MLLFTEVFDDKKCLSDGRAHASVLVGYTDEAWILKQSWGVDYGVEGGYTYLKRGSNAIQCNLFKDAVDVQMIKRRGTFKQGLKCCAKEVCKF